MFFMEKPSKDKFDKGPADFVAVGGSLGWLWHVVGCFVSSKLLLYHVLLGPDSSLAVLD